MASIPLSSYLGAAAQVMAGSMLGQQQGQAALAQKQAQEQSVAAQKAAQQQAQQNFLAELQQRQQSEAATRELERQRLALEGKHYQDEADAATGKGGVTPAERLSNLTTGMDADQRNVDFISSQLSRIPTLGLTPDQSKQLYVYWNQKLQRSYDDLNTDRTEWRRQEGLPDSAIPPAAATPTAPAFQLQLPPGMSNIGHAPAPAAAGPTAVSPPSAPAAVGPAAAVPPTGQTAFPSLNGPTQKQLDSQQRTQRIEKQRRSRELAQQNGRLISQAKSVAGSSDATWNGFVRYYVDAKRNQGETDQQINQELQELQLQRAAVLFRAQQRKDAAAAAHHQRRQEKTADTTAEWAHQEKTYKEHTADTAAREAKHAQASAARALAKLHKKGSGGLTIGEQDRILNAKPTYYDQATFQDVPNPEYVPAARQTVFDSRWRVLNPEGRKAFEQRYPDLAAGLKREPAGAAAAPARLGQPAPAAVAPAGEPKWGTPEYWSVGGNTVKPAAHVPAPKGADPSVWTAMREMKPPYPRGSVPWQVWVGMVQMGAAPASILSASPDQQKPEVAHVLRDIQKKYLSGAKVPPVARSAARREVPGKSATAVTLPAAKTSVDPFQLWLSPSERAATDQEIEFAPGVPPRKGGGTQWDNLAFPSGTSKVWATTRHSGIARVTNENGTKSYWFTIDKNGVHITGEKAPRTGPAAPLPPPTVW